MNDGMKVQVKGRPWTSDLDAESFSFRMALRPATSTLKCGERT